MSMFFSVLILISSISLIISVVLQEGSSQGLGAIGGGNAADSLWGKSRGKSRGELLKRLTIGSAVVFMISALVLAAI